MPSPNHIRRDLPADLTQSERDALAETGMRLSERRPIPDPNFRGALRRRLFDAPARRLGLEMRPRTVAALSATYSFAGLVLLAVAALGLAGSGPFAT